MTIKNREDFWVKKYDVTNELGDRLAYFEIGDYFDIGEWKIYKGDEKRKVLYEIIATRKFFAPPHYKVFNDKNGSLLWASLKPKFLGY